MEYDSDERERMRELINKKLQREKGAEKVSEAGEEERGKKPSRRYTSSFLSLYFLLFLNLRLKPEGGTFFSLACDEA